MDFSDETYVRLYTRKTLTWKLLGWEGRAVQRAMLGEFDAAGVFEIRGDAAQCISLVTEIPIELVRIGLQRLVETETWIVTARSIAWPSYDEAQTCHRSDRQRQRDSRRARAAKALNSVTQTAESVTDVTTEQRSVTDVTKCHSPSASFAPSENALCGGARVGAKSEPDPDQESAPELTEIRLLQPSERELRESERLPPEPETIDRIPETWVVSEQFYGEALLAGVTRAGLDEAVRYWRGRKLGGEWFSAEDFFRGKFTDIRKREERDRFKAAQRGRAPPDPANPKPKNAADGIREWREREKRLYEQEQQRRAEQQRLKNQQCKT